MKTLFTKSTKLTDRGIYITWHSSIYKASMNERTILWQREIAGLGPDLIFDKGVVYVYASQRDGIVYALQASTGQEIWSMCISPYLVKAGMQVNELMAMTLIDTVLYVLSFQGTLYALNTTTGVLLATYEIPPLQDIPLGSIELIIADGILYGSDQNNLYALNLQTTRPQWKTSIQMPQKILAYTLSNKAIYTIADLDPEGSYVYAFAADTGQQNWRSDLLPDPIFDAPVCDKDTTYCMGATTVYALNAQNGELRWEHFVGRTAGLKPCIENDMLYLCLAGAYQQEEFEEDDSQIKQCSLVALDRHTGELRWFRNLALQASTFHVKHGIFYLYCAAIDRLYAFGAGDGSVYWWLDCGVKKSDIDSESPGFGSSLIVIP
ncbi:hypothetical protein KDW_19510 [Dictyobacter vulcani]|uniref:Pyrrolo-quinoline quinone repeat domain-containing protein n=1 Tax=Dictyobacter vulcani TaxID=2607529 RepID=A0A5J4KNW1_9CHLR|nr:PQQ-binding-like beta-propeller repeat protein [Dictyobacter vulcani]GER87789.1 hypothetical protein KDW_19510 [Dictyobacter vulcani]